MHVATTRRQHKDKIYETHLLRRSYREDGKVKNETVANLSHLPADLIEMIRASLAGQAFVPAAAVATVARTRPHGHVAAVHAQAKALGLPALLGWFARPPRRAPDDGSWFSPPGLWATCKDGAPEE